MKFTPALLALSAALSVSAVQANEFEVTGYTGGYTFDTANTSYGGNYESAIAWSVGATVRTGAGIKVVKDFTTHTSFLAFCIEPLVGLSPATSNDGGLTTATYTSTTSGVNGNVQRLFDLWGWRVSERLDRHVYDPASTRDGAIYSAAMQLSIWELLTETSGSYNINSGHFKAYGSNSESASIRTLANSMLTDVFNPGALGGDPNNLTVGGIVRQTVIWDSSSSQDLIRNAGVIPEPSAYALIAAGLGVVAFAQRRRLTQAA